MTKIKLPALNKSSKLAPREETTIVHYKHPIFCFKYLHKDYGLEPCSAEQKISFVERLCTLSKMDWQDIQLAHRHGMGSEKIARSAIQPGIPAGISEDVEHFLALRFYGKAPFVGYRNKFVFHVVFIDHNFSVYRH